MFKDIETKVIAAAAGSGGGAAVSGFVVWLLGVLVWHASDNAGAAAGAVAAVPTPVSGLVLVVLAVLGSLVSGYAAPHTDRSSAAADSAPTGAVELPTEIEVNPQADSNTAVPA